MNIIVCIKQVPKKDLILRINDSQTWIRDQDLSFEINESDTYALEEALRLKEKHGGEVVVCSMGASRVRQAIKEALAKGANRAIHLQDDAFEGMDAFNTARCIAYALKDEKFDLILTGLQSDDYGFAQTGVILAELLGLPHATIVMEIQAQPDGTLKVKRELESGWFQWVQLPLPALLTIQSGMNQPRFATLRGIMEAKKKPVREIALNDLPWPKEELVNKQQIRKIYFPEKTKRTEIIEGAPKEAAARLVEKLKNEARVI